MRVLIAAAIFGISFGNYGCSNEAKFAGRPMAATEAPAAPASSPGAAITTTTGTTAGTTTIVTGNIGGTTTTGTTTVATMGTLPVVPSNWVDVTTTNGTTPSTCNATPANCTMRDPINGLKWSKLISASMLQSDGVAACAASTHNGQQRAGGWRLPTKDELLAAYTNGINTAARPNWLTGTDMMQGFYSSTPYELYPIFIWFVTLANGDPNAASSTELPRSIVCVQ